MDEPISLPGLETRIVSAILRSRGSYEQLKELLGDSYTEPFTPIARVCAEVLSEFYTRDGSADHCSKEILSQQIENKITSAGQLKAVQAFVSGLDESVSVPNLLYDIRQQRRRRIGDQLAGLLANRNEGREVLDLIDRYKALEEETGAETKTDNEGSIYKGLAVRELIDTHFSREGTIPFGLPKLNSACDGGARPGHHILVFARPELGKTLFALDLISYPLASGYSCLYVGNEEPISDILLRLVMRLSGRSKDQIYKDPEGAEKIALGRGYDRFVGASLAPGNFRQIDRLCDEYEPDIIVLDQLRNLNVGDDARVQALEKAAIGGRNLAKSRNSVVISLTQAGDSANGKPFLSFEVDIDSSKTGIPGAIDLAIGIGATEEYKRAGLRGISLSKNKLGGKHDTFLCRFNTITGVVEEAS